MLNSIAILLNSGKTVFSVVDLAILWQIENNDSLKTKIYYLTSNNSLIRLHHGIFAVNLNYNKYELAGKLNNPSYVSLETVLREKALIFQYGSEIISIGRTNKEYMVGGVKYKYRKIKDSILYNSEGLEIYDHYTIANKERAFLDMVYLNKNYYFDNLDSIDWKKCAELAMIYHNKNLIKRLKNYQKDYAGQE